MRESVAARGERTLLEEIRRLVPAAGPVLWGPGDDAALLARRRHPLLLTTDALVEGVHFRRGWLSPHALGRRAFAVNASDVAAMGGRPLAAVLAITAPSALPAVDLRAMVAGVRDAARAAGAALAGGNLARARELSLTVALLGEAPAGAIGRAGGRPGDRLFVTGALGAAALGLRTLRRGPSIAAGEAVRRWRHPVARLDVGAVLARRRLAAAMIDLSDGLLIDAERLCAASGVGAEVRLDRLPQARALAPLPPARARALALAGGEDYELLFAVRPARVAALGRAVRGLGCPVTAIGTLTRGRGVRLLDARGRPVRPPARAGFGHFGGR